MTKLEEIIAYKRRELNETKERCPLSQVEHRLKKRPPVRSFRQGIERSGKLSLIAELKRASPSAGAIRPDAEALEVAKVYKESGAQAISVLTDEKFFSGHLKDLEAVKGRIGLPVLRKDFLLEEYSVVEAAAAGADAVLLIVAILKETVLKKLTQLTQDLSMDALVEAHTEAELEEALQAGAKIVGINNRDLTTFKVDLKTTERLSRRIPQDRVVVGESGLHSRADVKFLERQGAHAVLIGEELMRAPDVGKRIKELMGW